MPPARHPKGRHANLTGPSIDSAALPPRRIPRASPVEARDRFLRLSVELTGYDAAELEGTGMVDFYLGVLISIVGDAMTGRLLSRWAEVAADSHDDPPKRERLLQHEILADATLGPLARNITVLWYTGQWNQLPADWRDAHGASAGDQTYLVSPDAYVQGLVWPTIGTHPQGARQAGYGSWSLPPATEAR